MNWGFVIREGRREELFQNVSTAIRNEWEPNSTLMLGTCKLILTYGQEHKD